MIYLVDMEHPGLVVFPTHRMVRDLPDFSKYNVLAGCEPYFFSPKNTTRAKRRSRSTAARASGIC